MLETASLRLANKNDIVNIVKIKNETSPLKTNIKKEKEKLEDTTDYIFLLLINKSPIDVATARIRKTKERILEVKFVLEENIVSHLSLLSKFAFEELNLNKISFTLLENKINIEDIENEGFTLELRKRKHAYFNDKYFTVLEFSQLRREYFA